MLPHHLVVCRAPGEPRPLLTYVRTKVRRLYDIANVLATLGLLERCMTPDTLKPGYRWLHAPGGSCAAPGPAPAPPPIGRAPMRNLSGIKSGPHRAHARATASCASSRTQQAACDMGDMPSLPLTC